MLDTEAEKAKALLAGKCWHEIAVQKPDKEGDYGSVKCEHCNEFGWMSQFVWYCPGSPDHACHYSYGYEGLGKRKKFFIKTINDEKCFDLPKDFDPDYYYSQNGICIFCGQPDERK